MATETKSGRTIKTPGKFSVCVSGKRKMHKGRKNEVSSLCDTTLETAFVDDSASNITSSSLLVNTSQATEGYETTAYDSTRSELETTVDTFHDSNSANSSDG